MTQPTDKRFVMEPRLDSEVVVLNDAIDLKANLTDARLTDTRTPTDNSVTSAKIVDGTIVDTDINAAAAIAVSKLAPIPLDALSDVVISGVVDKQTLQYELSSLSWKNKVASGGVTATDTKPASAINGDAWLDTNDGTLYVYYTDVNTSQWIQVVANSALEGTILARLGSLESQAIAYGNPNPNVIINGAFDIWQRGDSFAAVANNAFTADRWRVQSSVTPTSRTVERLALAGAISNIENVSYYLRSTVNTIGSGTSTRLECRIEDASTLAGKTVTFSWYGKQASAVSSRVSIRQVFGTGGSAQVIPYDETHAYTTSWQRHSATFLMPSIVGKTISSDSYVQILLFQDDSTGSALDITGVQLEQGSIATAFRRNSPNIQAELAACRRYYYQTSSSGPYSYFGLGMGYSATNGFFLISLPTTMRIAPNALTWSGTLSNYRVRYGTGSLVQTAAPTLPSYGSTTSSANVEVTTAGGLAAGGSMIFSANNNSDAFLGFSAEL
jgi:hypothetical protein